MFNVRLAGGHLYGKQLFTWLSLVVSLMASFVLSFFPLDVLDEIWDLIESVSEGFLTYSSSAGASYNIDNRRGKAYCVCSRCGWGLFGHFTLIYPFSSLSPSLWETARYRLKYCLKGPLNPKPTKQMYL